MASLLAAAASSQLRTSREYAYDRLRNYPYALRWLNEQMVGINLTFSTKFTQISIVSCKGILVNKD